MVANAALAHTSRSVCLSVARLPAAYSSAFYARTHAQSAAAAAASPLVLVDPENQCAPCRSVRRERERERRAECETGRRRGSGLCGRCRVSVCVPRIYTYAARARVTRV